MSDPHRPDAPPPSPEQQALQAALQRLASSFGRLAVARGLPYAAAEEMLKQSFVDAAAAAHPQLAPHRKVSRISAATGINRREVTRLTAAARGEPAAAAAEASRGRSLVGELFTRWRAHAAYRDAQGHALALPRQGAAPSFETLAQSVTRDMHPRSLLDELCRLGLARWDEASDQVSLIEDGHVPRGDRVRLLGFLGDNVGDHLAAAVDNVLADGRAPHVEQALFARGLSARSIESLTPLLREQWTHLREALVPALEGLIAADEASGEPADGRVRVGLYAYHEQPDGHAAGAASPAADAAAGSAEAAAARAAASTAAKDTPAPAGAPARRRLPRK